MPRAIIGYVLAAPLAMLFFWLVGAVLYPAAGPASLVSLLFGAVYFAPLMLFISVPGLALLVIWAFLLRSRGWLVASALAASSVLLVFAYSTNVMCRVEFFGPDCWGNFGFQLTEKSPFAAEYGMVFWSSLISSLVFWRLLSPRSSIASETPSQASAGRDA